MLKALGQSIYDINTQELSPFNIPSLLFMAFHSSKLFDCNFFAFQQTIQLNECVTNVLLMTVIFLFMIQSPPNFIPAPDTATCADGYFFHFHLPRILIS